MITRRQFSLGSVGALGAAMLPSRVFANEQTYQSFHANLPSQPWLRLYAGIHDEATGVMPCQVEGDWPSGLAGNLYRNGPGRMEHKGRRYQHWFDGDGLVQNWSITAQGQVTHQSRLVQTHKLLHDASRDKLSLVGFGTVGDDPSSAAGPDASNVGNISVLPRDDELWALWEGGSAWQLDRATLDTKDILELSTESSGLPFSAHPRVEPDGTVWNFGYVSHLGALVIWRIDPGKREPKIWVINRQPMTIPHDFMVTANYLVLPLPPLHFEPSHDPNQSFLDAHVWHPERSTDVMVMKKDNPNDHFIVELPSQWIFHFSNAWEDKDGVVRFEGMSYDTPGLMFDTFRTVMKGEKPTTTYESAFVQFRLDVAKRSIESTSLLAEGVATEFPFVDRRRIGQRHNWVTMLLHDTDSSSHIELGLLNGIARMNVETGQLHSFTFPVNEVPEEHLFVAKPDTNSETEGWLVGTSLDYMAEQTHLNVFELGNGSQPQHVARATLPTLMPLGLHGQFVAAT